MKKSNPMRRCIGCMQSFPQENLIRLTKQDNVIKIDYSGRANGRGMYLCRNEECVQNAFKRKSWNRQCRCMLDSAMLNQLNLEILKEVKNVKES